jgi:hypothetical protein
VSNLPFTLPTCTRPATVRLEVYTPAPDGGRGGSLDAAAYVCPDHTGDALAAIRDADFNAYPVPLAPDVERQCGHLYRFPTGNLGQAPHPSWCDQRDCARRGEHRSAGVHIDTNRSERTIVEVGLVQVLDATVAPRLWLTSVDSVDGGEPVAVSMTLSLSQGKVLSNRMRLIADGQDRRNGGRW